MNEVEYYQDRCGVVHIPMDFQKKLTFKKWHKDFHKLSGLDKMPVFSKWYTQQFEKLIFAGLDEEEMWTRLTALIGLLDARFDSTKIPFPKSWLEDRINCALSYDLNNVQNLGISVLDIGKWERNFWDPEAIYVDDDENKHFWWLQKNLVKEYVELFLQKVRKEGTLIGAKSTPEQIAIRNSRLRALIEEASWYDSRILSNGFYEQLPAFREEFKDCKDPAVEYALVTLKQLFVDERALMPWDRISELFHSYFLHLERLSTKRETKQTVSIIQREVSSYFQELLAENEKLKARIDAWEAE